MGGLGRSAAGLRCVNYTHVIIHNLWATLWITRGYVVDMHRIPVGKQGFDGG